ncbi:polyprenyl synthetase family protein [Lentzea sp. NPDC051208]|uniref:polyprenyl synthetase family protein n=1 Tax=Lentzea sp. NPDC051208 TaxID=3154642 RepID=UPI003443BCB4
MSEVSGTPHAVRQSRPAQEVAEILAAAKSLAGPAMHEAVESLHPMLAEISSYHLGWQDADGRPVPNGGGKGVCLAMAVLSAEAASAAGEVGVPGGVAAELVHVFTHMHDDIMDGDDRRRHRLSVWRVYGAGRAILTGDALLVLALEVLSRISDGGGRTATLDLLSMCRRMAFGQAQDLNFETRPASGPNAVGVEEYLAMSADKTGALYGYALHVGAVLAGVEPAAADLLAQAGEHLGVVAQAVDDVNGIWGDPAVTGKPALSDLRTRKKTLPVVAVLSGRTPAALRIAELLGRPADADIDLEFAAGLLEEEGGRRFAESTAREHHRMALDCLRAFPMPSPVREDLENLADFVLHRTA